MPATTRYILGIDDTDMPGTRGTGALARMLAATLGSEGLGQVTCITRHQLYRHPSVPFTSQNSSASLDLSCADPSALFEFTARFVAGESPEGSDPGIAMAAWDKINQEMVRWGRMAKSRLLSRTGAHSIASESELMLRGLGGSHDGIIGALASLGLRRFGDDGRVLWHHRRALRELDGRMKVAELERLSGASVMEAGTETMLDSGITIETNGWVRPSWSAHAEILYAHRKQDEEDVWQLLTKEELLALGR